MSNQFSPQSSPLHPALERSSTKYRGFRRTIRCLTIDSVVARHAIDGLHPVQLRSLCL